MKIPIRLAVAVAFVATAVCMIREPVDAAPTAPCLFPTGVDDNYSLLTGGRADPHYLLIQPDGSQSAAIVLSDANLWREWTRPADACWLYSADLIDSGLRGWVTFQTTFDLTGYDPSTVVLSGSWAADQYGWVALNNVDTGVSVPDEQWRALSSFSISTGFVSGINTLQFHVAMPDGGDGLVVSAIRLARLSPDRLFISLEPQTGVVLRCEPAKSAEYNLRKSADLASWSDTGISFGPGRNTVAWGKPEEGHRYFRIEPSESLTLAAPAADATTIQLKWPPLCNAREHRIFRDGVNVGSTAGRTGFYLDTGLAPDTAYAYSVTAYDGSGALLRTSATAHFSTRSSSSLRTHYPVLVLAFYPDGPNQDDLRHATTYLRHRLDFIRQASVNSAVLQPYQGGIISIRARPPTRFTGPFNIDYVGLVMTPYAELDGYTIVDLVEKGDVDAVWVVAAPDGCNFHENALVGNRDLNPNAAGEKWHPAPAKCSRSFFVNFYLSDARSYDAYVHMVEGILTTISDGYPANWPREYPYEVYTRTRTDFTTTYTANLHLFERFRLADAWNGVGGAAYASRGHGNCGSSHFPPNARRDRDASADYAYYDIVTWQHYIDCAADDWLHFPEMTGATRKLNGYDFGAFNHYTEHDAAYGPAFGASPELHPSFRTATASYHLWWFSHLPHNPGVAEGKLNHWWPYLFDFNRFNGSPIAYSVEGFPEMPAAFPPVNAEYGTELGTAEWWAYWPSFSDFGSYGQLSVVTNTSAPALVSKGQYALQVLVDQESFQYNGRNDVFYPISRNARWNLSDLLAVTVSIKLGLHPEWIAGANPVIRLCANGGNRIEFAPLKDGCYANHFLDNDFIGQNGWFIFNAPINGSSNWEVNVIGYIDPTLDPQAIATAREQLKEKILSEVNYVEISVRSEGGRGNQVSYYLDDIEFTRRPTGQSPRLGERDAPLQRQIQSPTR